LKKDGVDAEWLPLACDPEYHLNQAECADRFGADLTERVWDFAFVGFLRDDKREGYNNRVDYLDALFAQYKNSWYASNRFFEDMSLIYVKAHVGFNISVRDDLNMRVFEVMSTGTPLLTNYDVAGIDDLFTEDCYYPYVDIDGMLDSAELALSDTERDKVAQRAMNLVRRKHTYDIRMQRVREVMNGIT
jgi:spore maturation protein CgeB